MKLFKLIILFLVINFGALYIGTVLMNDGPQTIWYKNLNKAPWTPPGWFFGVAWTIIMICFSVYMAYLYKTQANKKLIWLFTLQFIFNIIWNYLFFNQHLIFLGLVNLILLTGIVGKFLIDYKPVLKTKTLLIVPYFVWLLVATSLNAYILIYN